MYWVSIGHYEAVAVGNWWCWFSRGHILHKVEIWTGVIDAWRTDGQTLKDGATQLLTKYKSRALVTQLFLWNIFHFEMKTTLLKNHCRFFYWLGCTHTTQSTCMKPGTFWMHQVWAQYTGCIKNILLWFPNPRSWSPCNSLYGCKSIKDTVESILLDWNLSFEILARPP